MTDTQTVLTLPLLTSSRLKDARACQRRHKMHYLDGYVPVEEAGPLRFGSMIHTALEAWWSHYPDVRLQEALAAIPADADPFEAAMARALMLGYDTRWASQEYEVLAVEHEFRVPLINPATGAASRTWQLAGKVDAIVSEAGRVLIVEHKTASQEIEPGSDYLKRLRLDSQVSVYFEGARAAGYPAEGCVYDVLRKPALRPLKATPEEERKYTKEKRDKAGNLIEPSRLYANQRENDETPGEYFERLCAAIAEDPTRYFVRAEVVRLDAEMADAMADLWNVGRQIREAEVMGRFPRNPDACVMYGRTCPYFAVCAGEASLEDTTLFRKVENVNPELSLNGSN